MISIVTLSIITHRNDQQVTTQLLTNKQPTQLLTMHTSTVSSIPISYETANHKIKLTLSFGEGKDGDICKNEYERKRFSKNYDVEVFESGEGEDYAKGYRVVANDNPLVIKIQDICINNENSKYDYGIGFAVDREAPEYQYDSSTIPNNITRDGTLWTIPANNGGSFNLDQNPNARFQWMAKKALAEGYKPTEKELELGMEESSQDTGLMYLTFMVYRKLKHVKELEPDYEPVYRGGATRGATRGSVAARFGYGNEATSASVKSTFEYAERTERYVLPIRLRIAEDSTESNINCSRHLEGASLNVLRRKTMTVPF